MPRVIRILEDGSQGVPEAHDSGAVVSNGSDNVITNGSQTARVGDPYQRSDSSSSTTHDANDHTIGNASEGSPTVFVNGSPIHRDGDDIACGDFADNGSNNVFAGP